MSINAEYAEAYFDECQILKAEIARLREDLGKALAANNACFAREWRLRAALEAQLEAHNYAEVLEIAREALLYLSTNQGIEVVAEKN